LFDVEQNIRLAAPPANDGRQRHLVNGSATSTGVVAERQPLSSGAMFSSKLASPTADQYEQFVRLQQLLIHVQTSGMLQPSDNGLQVNSKVYSKVKYTSVCIGHGRNYL